ncbi:transcription repressor NadR [Oceanirhabdus sp. W0125-5]|uniref:transcription repressor NadR n=1 Tax=Oceanirhabdus sp. W0125-5 TaxID=2999116 RepID=UPI0022F2F19D|nr:transcription repressor NadR [Oceanirhabdus sp. W0125-5]WBW97599.1 transcription repressor NadR [Oceanirhabdus sp. W0125-5]
MKSIERREQILKKLIESDEPIKGQHLAESYGVTRQVIVKDIAILRAIGNSIISTPNGYTIPVEDDSQGVSKLIAVYHSKDKIYDELKTIIKYGGIVKDVTVEHPVYGEITAILMLKNLYDIEMLIDKLKSEEALPLSALTKGIHLHTIMADSIDTIDMILEELKAKGYLLNESE